MWSSEGSSLSFHILPNICPADGRVCYDAIYVMTPGVPGATFYTSGRNPSWARGVGGLPPEPYFTATCNMLSCTYDASHSRDDGGIVGVEWKLATVPQRRA